MVEIYGQITSDKNFKLNKKVLGNKMDNSITKVILNEIATEANLLNKYVAFLSPESEIFLFPLNSEDNSFIVTTTITQYAGTWRILYLATNKEIIEGEIDTDYKVYVSNSTDFTITDNFLDDTIEEVIVDENLAIIYEQLEQTVIYLNSDEFKEDLINNLHMSESDILAITNNLKNDEEFKAELKGEPGEKGDPGEKGADGTVSFDELTEEQKESLKGESGYDGKDGKDGIDGVGISNIELKETDENGNNIYTITLSDNSTYDFVANKGDKGDPGKDGKDGKDGTMSFDELTEEQKESLKGDPGERGETGTGISNIELKETDENGNNIYTITLSDDSTYDFVANKGDKGDPGENGSFDDLTDEQKESLRGEPGATGSDGKDGKSAYESYLEQFDFQPLIIENLKGGMTLKITDERTNWEVMFFFDDNSYYTVVINDTEKYIQCTYKLSVNKGEKIYFDDNGEVVIPKTDLVNYNGETISIDIPYFIGYSLDEVPEGVEWFSQAEKDEILSNLFSIKNNSEPLTESAWVDSLKGESGSDYILTEEDKSEIAELVGTNFIISGDITRIEIVDSLPATEEEGVLYLVKE